MTMDAKCKNSSPTVHIGSILPDVLRTCRKESDTSMTGVWDVWRGAVGETIAQNTQPAAFKGRILIVHVSSSVWLHQLQFMKIDLVEKINNACGRRLVEEIKFKIGPLESDAGTR